jgi:hypothetical protein
VDVSIAWSVEIDRLDRVHKSLGADKRASRAITGFARQLIISANGTA